MEPYLNKGNGDSPIITPANCAVEMIYAMLMMNISYVNRKLLSYLHNNHQSIIKRYARLSYADTAPDLKTR